MLEEFELVEWPHLELGCMYVESGQDFKYAFVAVEGAGPFIEGLYLNSDTEEACWPSVISESDLAEKRYFLKLTGPLDWYAIEQAFLLSAKEFELNKENDDE